MPIFNRLHKRWTRPNGYRHVFAVSLPLVASMGTITLMQCTDRVFLANYSVDAITADLPAGILSFTLISFFMGVAGYTNSFVAQYTGAKALDRFGAAVWQGIYFSILAACFLALFYFLSNPLFMRFGLPSGGQFFLEIFGFAIFIRCLGAWETCNYITQKAAAELHMVGVDTIYVI